MKGLSRLKALGARAVRALPRGEKLRSELLAGIPGAIGSVPDGMAASVLAGVSPIHGLYASFAGPIAGGLTASTELMVITTTSAAALASGSALRHIPAPDRPGALFLLTALAGVAMIVAGIFRLGRYTRFVPHSVMIGFLTGVGANIIFGQVSSFTGAEAHGATSVAKAFDVLTHLGRVELASVAVGSAAIVLTVALARTRFAMLGALLALVIPSVGLAIFGTGRVATVADGGDIPRGIPLPALPRLGDLNAAVITGALAVAVIVLVQGAGVSESAPNPGGAPSNANVDFIAQGVANVSSGLFLGQPVGGSVGQTALNRTAGARTRWASVFSGVWMLVILAVLSGVVGRIAMPTLAGVLIVAAASSFRPAQIRGIWATSLTSRVAMAATFIATLLLPVAEAIGLGVALSLVMQMNQDALDLRVVELFRNTDGELEERPAPPTARSGEVLVLDVYGSLLYAGSRTLQARLPDTAGSERAAIVLRLRGRTELGATFFAVLSAYAHQLADNGGRLWVSGVDPRLLERMRRNGTVDDTVTVFEAETVLGRATSKAARDAAAWLAGDSGRHGET